jgi:hypothetical protein
MRKIFHTTIVAIITFISLNACTRNELMVLTPQNPMGGSVISRNIAERCNVGPEESKKYSPTPEIANHYLDLHQTSERPIDGCASIEYQLDAQGNPINGRVLKEDPAGYNIGSEFLRNVMATKFVPQPQGRWYYMNKVNTGDM